MTTPEAKKSEIEINRVRIEGSATIEAPAVPESAPQPTTNSAESVDSMLVAVESFQKETGVTEGTDVSESVSTEASSKTVEKALKGPEKDFEEIEELAANDPFAAAAAFHEKQSKVMAQIYPEKSEKISID